MHTRVRWKANNEAFFPLQSILQPDGSYVVMVNYSKLRKMAPSLQKEYFESELECIHRKSINGNLVDLAKVLDSYGR